MTELRRNSGALCKCVTQSKIKSSLLIAACLSELFLKSNGSLQSDIKDIAVTGFPSFLHLCLLILKTIAGEATERLVHEQ